MKRRAAGLWLSIASACLVIALATWDTRSASPGEVSAVHARSADIDEDDCAVCHGGSPSEMRAACAACHADVDAQVATGEGFHGRLADGARCGRCHSEHHGADFELAGAGSFALAGVPDRDAYAHEGLGFALGGDHVRGRACRDCHEHADERVLPDGASRFLGASQACAACHDDPHAGRLPDCRSCHGETEPFARVAEFVHPSSFALAGAHARAGCVECHARGSEHSIEAGGSARATRAARDCAACHDSPHTAPFVAAFAARVAVEAGASCASCHPVESGPFASAEPLSAADHAATGFALDRPHDRAACTDCHARLSAPSAHDAAFADYRAAHPGRAPDDCAACHADPHGGQFAGESCLACHERERFDPPAFGAAEHARTAFALTGAHASTSCDACHARVGAAPRAFRGTDARCSACHADAHGGLFERTRGASECSACHSTASFGDVARFDHARDAGFALVGAHATAACAACHATRERADEHGRRSGFVAERFPGRVDDCATCHVDAHGGFFARRSDATECASCHAPHDFASAAEDFDHARSTGFALDGAHARAACATCHPSSAATSTLRGVASPTRATIHAGSGPFDDCATCHVDVHAGAFDAPGRPRDVTGRTGCARCHTTESFDERRAGGFDHARWTGFALTGAHERAACASCHPREEGGDDARRYAHAAGTRCQDCHADPHAGQFARDDATDCARCHTTATTFLSVDFDHARDARFALDATHARLACASCHVPWPLPGGGSAVRYKPLGTRCGDCHDARGGRDR